MRQDNRRNRRRNAGFTLMELMIVLVIIGVLAAAVTPALVARAEKAKITRAKADIVNIANQVKMFKADNSKYPETLEDLVTKPSYAKEWPQGGYLEKLENDPWGNPYVLRVPGDNSREYDVISYGADGTQGGEDNDADLTYWTLNDPKK
jgi:general secretion pathway protein G